MQKIMYGILIAVVLMFSGPAKALERFDIVSTRQLKEMLRLREAGAVDFILVNSLDELIYRDAHIPGSINIPLARVDELIGRLGSDHNKLIIPY